MRVFMLSKALVVGTYQRKAEELARLPGVELTVAVPPYWREGAHRQALERAYTSGYDLAILPMILNGHYHLHTYRRLAKLLDLVRPDICHIDEEAYNFATFQAMRLARRCGAKTLFFTWQNLPQSYPPPFSWIEQGTFRRADWAIAGNEEAAAVLRGKRYSGSISVIPQFGVDPLMFRPAVGLERPEMRLGFVGRLVDAKGVAVLLRALAPLVHLARPWALEIVGTGEDEDAYRRLATTLGLAERVRFLGHVASARMPDVMKGFDLLVGPSLTTPRWKEQFGRMLVEAMASEVAVVGSSSGEIPNVIGDAGVVVPEGDSEALRDALADLMARPDERLRLARAGRARVLELFTQEAIARRTYAVYQEMLAVGG